MRKKCDSAKKKTFYMMDREICEELDPLIYRVVKVKWLEKDESGRHEWEIRFSKKNLTVTY